MTNEPDNELFEADLRRLRPARLPAELQARLEQARPTSLGPAKNLAAAGARVPGWWPWLRWLVPAAAAGVILLLVVARLGRHPDSLGHRDAASAPGLTANEVVIDRTLLSSFDTVARLPDGEPVRLRCREWLEAVTLRDSARGIEVQQRTPRLEIVPVAFETY